jgi:hypothetical protein
LDIETILVDTKYAILLTTPGQTREVVIGIPHHAPLGVTELPCTDHPNSDENAGFIGYHLSRLLGCPAVIACNYFLDPNKDLATDYSKAILNIAPKLLVEIHGHSTGHARFDIEISCGSLAENERSKEITRKLKGRLSAIPMLKKYTLSGDFNSIYYKATGSATITTSQWKACHVELPYPIRKSRTEYELLCGALAETIRELQAGIQ